MQSLKSTLDDSVNFVRPALEGFFECRYVRRTSDYFICYLSAQSACRQACKMCHLTVTKQTRAIDAGIAEVRDVRGILRAVRCAGLRVDVNIVRYNPYSPLQGREPTEEVIRGLAELIRYELPESTVKVVDRVGFDVKASCGMFVEWEKDGSK